MDEETKSPKHLGAAVPAAGRGSEAPHEEEPAHVKLIAQVNRALAADDRKSGLATRGRAHHGPARRGRK
mgnify:CR=1 FL=1